MTVVTIEKLEASSDGRYSRARIRGADVTVQAIILQHLVDRMPPEEIAEAFEIDLSGVYAALSYYYDNRAVIDRELAQDQAEYDTQRGRHPSMLAEKLRHIGISRNDVLEYLEQGNQEVIERIRGTDRQENE